MLLLNNSAMRGCDTVSLDHALVNNENAEHLLYWQPQRPESMRQLNFSAGLDGVVDTATRRLFQFVNFSDDPHGDQAAVTFAECTSCKIV